MTDFEVRRLYYADNDDDDNDDDDDDDDHISRKRIWSCCKGERKNVEIKLSLRCCNIYEKYFVWMNSQTKIKRRYLSNSGTQICGGRSQEEE